MRETIGLFPTRFSQSDRGLTDMSHELATNYSASVFTTEARNDKTTNAFGGAHHRE